MFRLVKADKDAYITNKIVKGERKTKSNVGNAGTLDLYKLYDVTKSGSSPAIEISRLLLHFDLEELKNLVSQGKIDIDHESFWAKIRLKDVYGGQPTPSGFTVNVFPLSSSFDEGLGRDVVHYSDSDSCNWISSSYGNLWFEEGCNKACDSIAGGGDYITSSINIGDTKISQFFKKGTEDLEIDVTPIISSTLSGEIPDLGFRISFDETIESNSQTYFVKRFGSRTVYNEDKRPNLTFGFDDSVFDDTQNLVFDYPRRLGLFNYVDGNLKNILSGTSLTEISGDDCLLLKLTANVSGGIYDLYFTGSQSSHGKNYVSGSYFSDVVISSSDAIISQELLVSSSIDFTPTWTSLDSTVEYSTSEKVTFSLSKKQTSRENKNYIVSIKTKEKYNKNEDELIRVNIFDQTSPLIKVVKTPVELPGIVVKNAFYQVRDVITNEIVIPYDDVKNSTKISSDSNGMFFIFNTSPLLTNRTYVFDIIILQDGIKTKFEKASSSFRIENGDET